MLQKHYRAASTPTALGITLAPSAVPNPALLGLHLLGDSGLLHVHYLLGQRSIRKRLHHGLAFVQHPEEEILQNLSLLRVRRIGRNQQPGKAGNRVRVLSGWVGDRDAE